MVDKSKTHGEREFVDRVRRATGGIPPPSPPELDESVIRCVEPGSDLRERFVQRATTLGVGISECKKDALLGVLKQSVVRHGQAVIEPALVERFPELAERGRTDADDDVLFDAGCGITGVDFAIAETGSLVVSSGATKWRQFSFVPPVHIAVVEATQLVPDLLDVLGSYASDARLAANFVIITGPSRTADIAQRLVQGVHGPIQVECVLID